MAQDYTDRAHALISSRRVEGADVYGPAGEALGDIHSLMIDKKTGQVAFALLTFGGFLGIAGRVHPIPWEALCWDVRRDGYVVPITDDELRAAPTLTLDEAERPRTRDEADAIAAYYGQLPWWGM